MWIPTNVYSSAEPIYPTQEFVVSRHEDMNGMSTALITINIIFIIIIFHSLCFNDVVSIHV